MRMLEDMRMLEWCRKKLYPVGQSSNLFIWWPFRFSQGHSDVDALLWLHLVPLTIVFELISDVFKSMPKKPGKWCQMRFSTKEEFSSTWLQRLRIFLSRYRKTITAYNGKWEQWIILWACVVIALPDSQHGGGLTITGKNRSKYTFLNRYAALKYHRT